MGTVVDVKGGAVDKACVVALAAVLMAVALIVAGVALVAGVGYALITAGILVGAAAVWLLLREDSR